jgi:osmotically-inducible protein OsmY
MTYPDERYYYSRYTNPQTTVDRSDGDIKSEVVDRLRENSYTKDYSLTVDVKAGVVVLSGDVPTVLAKRVAGDDVWDTPGVVDVSNQLRVTPTA